jgi:hypothetical protein
MLRDTEPCARQRRWLTGNRDAAISTAFATFSIIASAFRTEHWLPALLVGEFVEQCFRVFEVGGVEALGEPVVDVGEHRARLIAATSLRCEQSR